MGLDEKSLKNTDLAYASNLSSFDLLSIYMYAHSIDEEDERDKQSEKCRSKQNHFEKVKAGRKSGAGGPLDFASVDEC